MSRRTKRWVAPIVHRFQRFAAPPREQVPALRTLLVETPGARESIAKAETERVALVNSPAFWRKVWEG